MVVWEPTLSFFPTFSHIDQDHLVISSAESLPSDVRSVLGPIHLHCIFSNDLIRLENRVNTSFC